MSLLSRDPLANVEPLIERVYAYVAYRIGAGARAVEHMLDVERDALVAAGERAAARRPGAAGPTPGAGRGRPDLSRRMDPRRRPSRDPGGTGRTGLR